MLEGGPKCTQLGNYLDKRVLERLTSTTTTVMTTKIRQPFLLLISAIFQE